MSPESTETVTVQDLLAEAGRRIRALDEEEPAGMLAVVEVRMPPGGAGEEATVSAMVDQAAAQLGGWMAFDDVQGHYLLLLPMTRTWVVAEALDDLLHDLAAVEVCWGRHRLRPSVGAGLVALAGHADPTDGIGEIDLALTEAIGLAQRSTIERALRVQVWTSPDRHLPPRTPHKRAVDEDKGPSVASQCRDRYRALTPKGKVWVLAIANLVIAWLLPFLAYSALYLVAGIDVSGVGFWVVLGAVVLTALTVYCEALLALRPNAPPPGELAVYPSASAIVVAYLPNEVDTIEDTLHSLLAQDYPGQYEVVLAYNSPRRLPIEADLAALAAGDARLRLLRVGDSTSKAQNINAALQVTTGEFIGIFDSDHRPRPGAFRRAAAWLASGADVVQGRSVVRNGSDNWLARMVAVEFEGIYAVAHPGRGRLHDFGIFGGSNGFWRADVLQRLRMRPDMLTEDIDISIRAVFSGCRIEVDPMLVSEELAPITPMALWSQRMRWSHGWHQVSRRQLRRVWRTECLSLRQRLGASFLLGWREAYPWVAAQMIPILAFSVLIHHHFRIHWLAPLFVATTLYVSAVGPVQALFAWRLSVPELRRRRSWWWQYVLLTGVLFGEFKALVNRAAHLRELLGDRAWQVTPRGSAAGGPGTVARLRGGDPVTELVAMGPAAGQVVTLELDRPLPPPSQDTGDGTNGTNGAVSVDGNVSIDGNGANLGRPQTDSDTSPLPPANGSHRHRKVPSR